MDIPQTDTICEMLNSAVDNLESWSHVDLRKYLFQIQKEVHALKTPKMRRTPGAWYAAVGAHPAANHEVETVEFDDETGCRKLVAVVENVFDLRPIAAVPKLISLVEKFASLPTTHPEANALQDSARKLLVEIEEAP